MNSQKLKAVIFSLYQFLKQGGSISEEKYAISEFNNLIEKEEKQNTVMITSAHKLSKVQKEKLKQIVAKVFEKNMDYEYIVDLRVLAGIKIKVLDTVIDMTLGNTLSSINQALKQ